MHLVERIEDQISATGLPLVGITLAAVPCPDTPVILHAALAWLHQGEARRAGVRRGSVLRAGAELRAAVERPLARSSRGGLSAAMEAAWELGAWDIARAERRSCMRPGAPSTEALECLQAFGSFPFGVNGSQMVVAEAPRRRRAGAACRRARSTSCGSSARSPAASGPRSRTTPPSALRVAVRRPARIGLSLPSAVAAAGPCTGLGWPLTPTEYEASPFSKGFRCNSGVLVRP